MKYKAPKREFAKVQFGELREQVDPEFNALHDELTESYYNYWKKGESRPFAIDGDAYDVQDTPEESKVLFDKLHGFIFDLREVKFHDENLKKPESKKIDEDKYRYTRTREDGRDAIIDHIQLATDKVGNFKLEKNKFKKKKIV